MWARKVRQNIRHVSRFPLLALPFVPSAACVASSAKTWRRLPREDLGGPLRQPGHNNNFLFKSRGTAQIPAALIGFCRTRPRLIALEGSV
jgi:hypothetical protein